MLTQGGGELMRLEPKTIAVAICAALIGGLAVVAWNSRGSYEQCLIEEMRGQPSAMQLTVARICYDRYGKKK